MFKEVSMEEAAVKAAQGETAIMIWKDNKDMRFLDLKEEISGVFDVKGARYLIDEPEEKQPLPEAEPEIPPPENQVPDRDRKNPAQSREGKSKNGSTPANFTPYTWPAGVRLR